VRSHLRVRSTARSN